MFVPPQEAYIFVMVFSRIYSFNVSTEESEIISNIYSIVTTDCSLQSLTSDNCLGLYREGANT